MRTNTAKAIEASAFLIAQTNRRMMGKKKLLALLYIADRLSLEKIGRPIIGGRLSALRYGPIHSEVLDLINGYHHDGDEWSRHFSNESYLLKLEKSPEPSQLSRFEIELLGNLFKKFQGFDDFDVAEVTHKFKEYKDRYIEGTSTTIPLADMIAAVGRDDGDRILDDLQASETLDKALASCK